MTKWLALALLCASSALAQTVTPLLQPHQQFVDNSGLPCSGCLLFTYAAGTTTPQATFTDVTGLVQNTNPVVLDATGSANIWLGSSPYKFLLQNALGSTLWTVDQVSWVGGYLPLHGGTVTGAVGFGAGLTTSSINKIIKVDQLTGATADVKMAACFTALGSTGGICDATGFGATSQTIAATIANTSGVPVQVIWDPATKLMPGSTTVQMFHLNRGIQMFNAHIDIADSGFRTTYTGTVFLIDDNIRDQDNFLLQNTYIDNVGAETQPAAGSIGLKMNATDPSLHSQVFARIDNFTCRFLDKCIVMTATGSGFMNSNMFTNVMLEGCTTCWAMTGTVSPASPIESTTVNGLAIQSDGWTTTPISGSGDVAFTQILGCGIWDNPGTYDIVWDSATANNHTICFNPKGINDQTASIAGAEHNTYHAIRGSANQQASDVFNSVFSYDKLEGAYLYAIGKTSVAYAAGSYIEWNLTNGSGEMDFVSDRGGNVGGFNWYNVSTGDLSAGTPIMQLDGSGNLTPAGSVTAAGLTTTRAFSATGGSSTHGFTSAHLALPGAPTVTVTGAAGATSYTYACTAVDVNSIETPLGTTTVNATGNASLSVSNYNAVLCPTGGGVTDNVYRTAGGATQGKIGTVSPGGTLNDTGLAASGSAPGSNLTGGGNFAGSLQWGGGIAIASSSAVGQISGSAVAAHAACIKTVSPLVIGSCSTQPDAGGACTCN